MFPMCVSWPCPPWPVRGRPNRLWGAEERWFRLVGEELGGSVSTCCCTATGPHGGVMLEAEWDGAPLSIEVGPAAVNEAHSQHPLKVL